MAISTTTLNGTDSVAASRITLNDNFNTVKDALNSVLSIVDIATGKINNYGFGSNNDIETEDLTVRGSGGSGGIFVLNGNVNVNNGNVVIGSSSNNSFLQVGGGNNAIFLERIQRTFTSGATIPTVNLSGSTAGVVGVSSVGYVTLPRLTDALIKSVKNPTIGSIAYSIGTVQGSGYLVICTNSSSVVGATGTWTKVTLGSVI